MVSSICLSQNTLYIELRAKDLFLYSLLTHLIPKVTDIGLPFNPFYLSPNIHIRVKNYHKKQWVVISEEGYTTDMWGESSTYISN